MTRVNPPATGSVVKITRRERAKATRHRIAEVALARFSEHGYAATTMDTIAHDAGVAMLGLVENLASSVCARCGAEGPLFHEASTEATAVRLDLAVLARIPFDARAAAAADAGQPLAEAADGIFDKLAEEAVRRSAAGAAR